MTDELLTPGEIGKCEISFPAKVNLSRIRLEQVRIWALALGQNVAKAQLAKANKHRLDSPDREKIDLDSKFDQFVDAYDALRRNKMSKQEFLLYLDDIENQILALIPDVEEIRKQVKQELCANCDTPLLREGELYQKLEQAKREERDRVIEWLKEKYSLGIVPSVWDEIKQVLEREK